MPKVENEKLVRVHLHIFESDLEMLRILYEPTIGYNKATRHIIRKFLNGLRSRSGGKPVAAQVDLGDLP